MKKSDICVIFICIFSALTLLFAFMEMIILCAIFFFSVIGLIFVNNHFVDEEEEQAIQDELEKLK